MIANRFRLFNFLALKSPPPQRKDDIHPHTAIASMQSITLRCTENVNRFLSLLRDRPNWVAQIARCIGYTLLRITHIRISIVETAATSKSLQIAMRFAVHNLYIFHFNHDGWVQRDGNSKSNQLIIIVDVHSHTCAEYTNRTRACVAHLVWKWMVFFSFFIALLAWNAYKPTDWMDRVLTLSFGCNLWRWRRQPRRQRCVFTNTIIFRGARSFVSILFLKASLTHSQLPYIACRRFIHVLNTRTATGHTHSPDDDK